MNTCQQRLVVAIESSGVTVLRSEPIPFASEFGSAMAGSTAFDFRGAGSDWIAYHPHGLGIFAGARDTALDALQIQQPFTESYPVVADIDNDASADVLVMNGFARVVAYEDAQKRPSPARRIWNQWNYAPSQVREDAIVTASGDASSLHVQRRVACADDPGPPR